MPMTRTPSAARLRNRMRRVRLEKMWWRRKRRNGTSSPDMKAVGRRSDPFPRVAGFLISTSMAIDQVVPRRNLRLAKPIPDTIQRFDHVEIIVDGFELLAQALDMAVDGPVVDVYLLIIGRIHQRVTALHDAGALGQRMQDQELGHRQRHRLALPGAGVTLLVHHQLAALQRLRLLV